MTVKILGALILLLMSISCRMHIIENKEKEFPKWVCWFGNILCVLSLIGAVAILVF
jgi:hypothetical protein